MPGIGIKETNSIASFLGVEVWSIAILLGRVIVLSWLRTATLSVGFWGFGFPISRSCVEPAGVSRWSDFEPDFSSSSFGAPPNRSCVKHSFFLDRATFKRSSLHCNPFDRSFRSHEFKTNFDAQFFVQLDRCDATWIFEDDRLGGRSSNPPDR